MLLSIHVKNFALIEEADIELDGGLVILTGETGAGKSILIDSVTAALGGRTKSDVIGGYGDSAFIQLVFSIDDENKKKALLDLDISCEYDTIIISRRISRDRSVFKINDETVTAGKVKAVTEHLIDIHGQFEHQSLLREDYQLSLVDHFAENDTEKAETSSAYKTYLDAQNALKDFNLDEEARVRELDFIKFEIDEIESAGLYETEEAELEAEFKKFYNASKIARDVDECLKQISEGSNNASDSINAGVRSLSSAANFDEGLSSELATLTDASNILDEAVRALKAYSEGLDFDSSKMDKLERRLDEIRHLEQKYGADYQAIMASLEKRKLRASMLEDYEVKKAEAEKALESAKIALEKASDKLSASRKRASEPLAKAIITALNELNFLDVKFEIAFEKNDGFTEGGYDRISYQISTNPGEKVRPLAEIVSGGELSRIMLGFKAVLADKDEIPSLIFDEIDSGISGVTAAMVAEKLRQISKYHQVICITHLPQIAAAASSHFCIEKTVADGKTITSVRKLDSDGELDELARLLGGGLATEAVYENARQLKTRFLV